MIVTLLACEPSAVVILFNVSAVHPLAMMVVRFLHETNIFVVVVLSPIVHPLRSKLVSEEQL